MEGLFWTRPEFNFCVKVKMKKSGKGKQPTTNISNQVLMPCL